MDKNYVICGASNIKNNDVLNELIKNVIMNMMLTFMI